VTSALPHTVTLALITLSSLRDDAIKDEIDAFDQFRKYIKEHPESDAALTVNSAGQKRKAFRSLEADEVDGEENIGSEAGDGDIDNRGDQGGDDDGAVGGDDGGDGNGTGDNDGDNVQS
jgi:hypothetical protein